MAAEVSRRRFANRRLATFFASLGFVILVVGVTYFAMLVAAVKLGAPDHRAASYYELGKFLAGGLEWYQDARVYGALSLLCALISILFGVHPMARVTIPISGLAFVTLHFWGPEIWDLITKWARDT